MTDNTQPTSLKSMKLRSGMSLQIQSVANGAHKEEAQFMAAIENKGVMLSPHSSGSLGAMKIGSEYLVSGFTGQHDFSFRTSVIQTFEQPLAYTLLTYPREVSAGQVRCALRIKTSRPARVTANGHARPLDTTLLDISRCGSMLNSPSPLGAVGETVHLSLRFDFEGEPIDLSIPSTICHSNRAADDRGINVGLAFNPSSATHRLLLHYLAQSSAD